MFSNNQQYSRLSKKKKELVLHKINEKFLYANTPIETLRAILEDLDPPLEIREEDTLVISIHTVDRIKKHIQQHNLQAYVAVHKTHKAP